MEITKTSLPAGWRLLSDKSDGTVVNRVLRARGYESAADQAVFLSPNFDRDTYGHRLLKDIDKAVKRLIAAKESNELVAVYGDYDADGIPATVVALRALAGAGFTRLTSHIPTRAEGYGLHTAVIERWAKEKVSLIITVDTGISAVKEIAAAAKLGIEVIVTDHHEPVVLPAAVAIINPKQTACRYPNKHLSGTAVVYKLMWALYDELGLSHTNLKWMIDLVGLSLIADMMPLVGENRALAHYGLQVLRKTKNIGLRSLMRVAGIDREAVNEYHVSFGIAPRLNAVSRLAKEENEPNAAYAHLGLALLMSDDPSKSLELAALINQVNQERRDLVAQFSTKIRAAIKTVPTGGIAYYDPTLPTGISGLVAGEFTQQSGWPCLIMGGEVGHVRGSGRSPSSLSLVELLKKHDRYLLRYGGHHEAAGWTVKPGEEDNFVRAINESLAALAKQHPARERVAVDTYLRPAEATLSTAQSLAALAPFGVGNEQPLLLVEDTIAGVDTLRNGNHRRLRLSSGYPDAVWFNAPADTQLTAGTPCLLAVHLEVNDYFDQPRPQLLVKHLSVIS